MRKTIAEFIKEDEYLIHCDMFDTEKFPTKASTIDCLLGESNAINVASGLASTGSTVYLYGVAGFIIHRYEQLKFSARNFGSKKGKIIIFNAGRIGYGGLGDGHKLDDDLEIMGVLNISTYCPNNRAELLDTLNSIETHCSEGIFYIQLGSDY